MLVPKKVIQEIKDRLDIAAIVGEYVHSLKKVGKNWVGLCPFHNDHNPSFNVSPDIGIYKCFSCGEGGDVVGFVQKIENITFTEAVKILAQKAGIQLDFSKSEFSEEKYLEKDKLIQFNNRLIKLFQHFLLEKDEGKAVLKYLYNRGINQELISIFKIGYVPKEYNRLANFFLKRGFKEEFLVTSGIFSKDGNKLKSLFFDRVVFPIINQKEECIGFGGRVLNDEIKPKYINTTETLVYKKSNNLYGINLAKNIIREEKRVFLVEGYVDVISCYKNGIKNAVAPCGTAVTKEQIILLNRYAQELILLLDGDEAGKKGAEKALKESANILIKTNVLVLPDQMDPDDYFKKYTIADFKEFEKNKLDGFDFLIKYKTEKIDIRDFKFLTEALNALFTYIELWDSDVIKNTFIERIAAYLKLEKAVIAREFLTFSNKRTFKKEINNTDTLNNIKSLSQDLKKEIDLILLLLKYEESNKIIIQCGLREEHFYYPYTQKIFRLFFYEENSIKRKDFIDYIDDNEIKKYIEERIFSEEFKQKESVLRNNIIDRIINTITFYYKKKKNKPIDEKLKLAVLYKDNDLIRKLQEEKTIYTNEIFKLSKLQELKK